MDDIYRYANAGLIVDLADSTNLPTRAHQGVTSGHGIHGAQGQGGFNSMPFSNSGYGGRW